MIVKTITNTEIGRKLEIVKREEDCYDIKYYEFFAATGWRFIFSDLGYTKDCVEFELNCTVA